eukprot:COSAG05_NODE_302_length_11841_cov_253.738801_9_plen_130_part_00
MTAVAAEAAVVVDNSRETSGETSLWHGAAAGAAARVDPLLRRIRGLTRFDRVSCGRWLNPLATYLPSTHAVQHRPFSSGHVPQRRRAIRHELVKGEKDRRGEGSGGYKPPAAMRRRSSIHVLLDHAASP